MILNSIFTTAVLYVYLKIGSEPVVLIGAWFGFTTGELWLLSSIKKEKVKNNSCVDKENNKKENSKSKGENSL